jgi:FkbM family methyltransferase
MFLIPEEKIMEVLNSRGIKFSGALHVGAHECEELETYQKLFGIPPRNMVWVDALQDKVDLASSRGVPNVYYAVVSDKDGDTVSFKRTNNGQSSSILDFGTHSRNHPSIVVTGVTQHTTTTIDTFMKRFSNPEFYDFWNFDIQGAELLALKGAQESIKHVKAMYLEVNIEEVYKGGALMGDIDSFLDTHGFERVITYMTHAGWGDALYVRK